MTAPLSLYEHTIEDTLALQLGLAGCLCLKFISPGFPGVPDRILLAPGGRVLFVEVKAPGQPLRRAQPKVVEALRKMGHRVEIVDTLSKAQALARELSTPRT